MQEEDKRKQYDDVVKALMKQAMSRGPLRDFRYPVDDRDAPGYSSIVEEPMDLTTLETMVRQRRITSLQHLGALLMHMWHNAFIYNPPGSEVLEAAEVGISTTVQLLQAAAQRLGVAADEDPAWPPLPSGDEPRPPHHAAAAAGDAAAPTPRAGRR